LVQLIRNKYTIHYFSPPVLIPVLLILFGCSYENSIDPDYAAELSEWKAERYKSLTSDDGYLVLAGLYWLKPGINTYGSDPENDIVFPSKVPPRIGSFDLRNDSIYTIINNGIEIFNDNKLVDSLLIYSTDGKDKQVLSFNEISWYAIKRGDQFGIRLKDLKNPVRQNFGDLNYFETSKKWLVDAKFVRHEKPVKIPILNIIGITIDSKSEGQLTFEIDGITHSLDVLEGGEDTYFVIFGDKTNGETTYGAGRYMYPEKPGSDGKVILDFNKAYNPPCAFTEFATCPLPPKQNILDLEINAGEMNNVEGDESH